MHPIRAIANNHESTRSPKSRPTPWSASFSTLFEVCGVRSTNRAHSRGLQLQLPVSLSLFWSLSLSFGALHFLVGFCIGTDLIGHHRLRFLLIQLQLTFLGDYKRHVQSTSDISRASRHLPSQAWPNPLAGGPGPGPSSLTRFHTPCPIPFLGFITRSSPVQGSAPSTSPNHSPSTLVQYILLLFLFHLLIPDRVLDRLRHRPASLPIRVVRSFASSSQHSFSWETVSRFILYTLFLHFFEQDLVPSTSELPCQPLTGVRTDANCSRAKSPEPTAIASLFRTTVFVSTVFVATAHSWELENPRLDRALHRPIQHLSRPTYSASIYDIPFSSETASPIHYWPSCLGPPRPSIPIPACSNCSKARLQCY